MAYWFKPDPEPEAQEPPPVRLASDEFLSGLDEVRERYAAGAKGERASVARAARELTEKTHFNFGDVDRAVEGIRGATNRALHFDSLAAELLDTINSYKYQGRRPPYMPSDEG